MMNFHSGIRNKPRVVAHTLVRLHPCMTPERPIPRPFLLLCRLRKAPTNCWVPRCGLREDDEFDVPETRTTDRHSSCHKRSFYADNIFAIFEFPKTYGRNLYSNDFSEMQSTFTQILSIPLRTGRLPNSWRAPSTNASWLTMYRRRSDAIQVIQPTTPECRPGTRRLLDLVEH